MKSTSYHPSGLLAEVSPAGVQQVQEAVAGLVARGKDEKEEEAKEAEEAGPAPSRAHEHVMVHYFASRALRRWGVVSCFSCIIDKTLTQSISKYCQINLRFLFMSLQGPPSFLHIG